MLKKISVLCFLMLSIYGENYELTLYPSNSHAPSLVNAYYDNLNVYKNVMNVKSLPIGIVSETIEVMDPVFERVSYLYDFENEAAFYQKIMGQTVYYEHPDGKRNESTFINHLGNNDYVKQGSQIVINPEGKLHVPVNQRFVIEPELEIEVSARYKAYKKASLSYYNRLLTSYINYEYRYYSDTNSMVVLTHLIVDNKTNQSFTGLVTYSSKSPQFQPVYPEMQYALSRQQASPKVAFTPSETFEETLKKAHTLSVGKTKIPVTQTSITKVTHQKEIVFDPFQPETHAKRVLTFKNEGEAPFLPGNVYVYLDDELSIVTKSPYLSVGEMTSVTLTDIFEIEAKKIITATNKPDIQHVLLVIENHSNKDHIIEVVDRLPKDAIMSRKSDEYDPESHSYKKQLSINPMEKKTLEYTYSTQKD